MAVAAGGSRTNPRGTRIVIDPARPDYRNTPASPHRPRHPYRRGVRSVPAVSIVTPFFNTGSVFRQTASCVLAQSLQNYEWLIVNDASSEPDALRMIDECRHTDARVRVIDLPVNVGPGAARNIGCAAARAPYLLLLDSDDLLERTAAEKWWWFLESYAEFGFVKGFSVGFGAMEYLASAGFHDEAAFLDGNRVDITSLIRAEVYRAAGGFPEGNRDGLEDWEFWLRCARAGFWGGTVPEYLSWYRRRDDDARRWPNWQGDGGTAALRARMRREFSTLYANPQTFPAPRPRQIDVARDSGVGARPLASEPSDRTDIRGREAPDEQEVPGGTALRLLMIVPWMTVGGADKFNLDLVTELTRRGWNVSIAAVLQGDMAWLPAFANLTPDVFVLPNILRLSDYPRFLRDLIHSRRVDVVMIANAELGYRLLPYLRAECRAAAFVDFCHMEQEEWHDGGYPRFSIDAAAFLDRSIVLSAHLRQWMIQRGRTPEAIAVSHNGVAIPNDDHIGRQRVLFRDRWAVGNAPTVLFAGRLVDQKQPHVFVESLGRLWMDGVPCTAVVAGDGPWLPAMRARFEQMGATSRVWILGAVTPEVMDGVLCAADLVCLPSRWEGIALVIQEAMARGVAVVAADVGGQRELITPECGVLVAPGRDEDLATTYAAALRLLIEQPERRLALGACARARVREQFGLAQMGARMDALLRDTARRTDEVDIVAPDAIMESVRSQYAPYWQWVTRVAAGRPEPPRSWNARFFRSLTMLEPAYRWGVRRGWTWLPTLRRRLRGPVREWLRLDA